MVKCFLLVWLGMMEWMGRLFLCRWCSMRFGMVRLMVVLMCDDLNSLCG